MQAQRPAGSARLTQVSRSAHPRGPRLHGVPVPPRAFGFATGWYRSDLSEPDSADVIDLTAIENAAIFSLAGLCEAEGSMHERTTRAKQMNESTQDNQTEEVAAA